VDIVIDSSALLAVIMDEPERDRVIELTSGCTLVGPGAIPWEIGNAFSAMLKQGRMPLDQAQRGIQIFETIPIRYVNVDLAYALRIAHETSIYAYDAYFLDCALRYDAPLLTLDRQLIRAARHVEVKVLEV